MLRSWKSFFGLDRTPDPDMLARLKASEKELAVVEKQGEEVEKVSKWLATRRKQNHFGDALTISFTPRSNHA